MMLKGLSNLTAVEITRRSLLKAAGYGAISLGVGSVLQACGIGSSSTPTSGRKIPSIVSITQPLQNSWVGQNVRFQQSVAGALGIKLQVIQDYASDESSVAAVRQAIALQPDAILRDSFTQSAGVAGAALMEKYNIPFAEEDRGFLDDISSYKGKNLVGQIWGDGPATGVSTMTQLLASGATKIVTVFPPHGILIVEQAWAGAKTVLAQHPEAKIVQETWTTQTREAASQVMQRYLVAYSKGQMDGLWSLGSDSCLGCIQVIKQAGRYGEFKGAVTWDIDPGVIDAIKSGDLTTSNDTHWLEGGWGLIVLYDSINGHPPLNRQPAFTFVNVSKDTADAYNSRFITGDVFTADEIKSQSLTYNSKADLPAVMKNFAKTWSTSSRGMPPYT